MVMTSSNKMEIDSETTEHFITSVERHRILLYDCTDMCCHDEDRKNNRLHSFRWQWNSTSPLRSVTKTLDFIAVRDVA